MSEKEEFLQETISHLKDGWHVFAKNRKHMGGPYKTKEEAVERLRQIEGHKKG